MRNDPDGIWNGKSSIGHPLLQTFVMSSAERSKRRDDKKREELISRVVILDMETDPFDPETGAEVWPFCTCIYADPSSGSGFCYHIWKDNTDTIEDYRQKILKQLEAIDGKRLIYAHNGGKFDYMFLLGPEMRGKQIWKGKSLADTKLFGRHTLRDSMHIMPGALRTFKKEDFDYEALRSTNRHNFRPIIERYVKSDCANAYPIVVRFLRDNGLKMTIGQASIARLKKHYTVSKLSEHIDGKIRGIDTNYYHKETYGKPTGKGYYGGGRVETIAGRGIFVGDYTLYDINSMYPFVMAHFRHPIGSNIEYRSHDDPNANTAFIHIRCNNHGALVTHAPGFHGQLGLTADVPYGEFFTTIHEYKIALQLGLIENVEILECIDVDRWSDFSMFVLPLYEERQALKQYLYNLRLSGKGSGYSDFDDVFLRDLFIKFYLNNAYGKFGQNPRNFNDVWLTGTEDDAPFETVKSEYYKTFALHYKRTDRWEDGKDGRPGSYALRGPKDQLRFYNIATAASITGAARSVLLHAIWHSNEPLYCDTDSLICHSLGSNTEIDEVKLGAWKIEKRLREVVIAGKKLYSYIDIDGNYKVKSKGVGGLLYEQMKQVEQGLKIMLKAKGVTINKDGSQYYMTRTISATAQYGPSLLRQYYNLKRGN